MALLLDIKREATRYAFIVFLLLIAVVYYVYFIQQPMLEKLEKAFGKDPDTLAAAQAADRLTMTVKDYNEKYKTSCFTGRR